MNILFIDDERDADKVIPKDILDIDNVNIVTVRTSRDAIDLVLNTYNEDPNHIWHQIWFDHDLGENNTGDPIVDSTYPVAQLFAEAVFSDTGLQSIVELFVIHTANPVGRVHLAQLFDRWNLPYKHHYI